MYFIPAVLKFHSGIWRAGERERLEVGRWERVNKSRRVFEKIYQDVETINTLSFLSLSSKLSVEAFCFIVGREVAGG